MPDGWTLSAAIWATAQRAATRLELLIQQGVPIRERSLPGRAIRRRRPRAALARPDRSPKINKNRIAFLGTVEKIGRDPGAPSGVLAVYQLAQYRVDQVCEGEYVRKEIVVDHLIGTGDELNNIRVGDRVCVSVKISKSILVRNDEEGFRSAAESIEEFYIGGRPVKVAPETGCRECR